MSKNAVSQRKRNGGHLGKHHASPPQGRMTHREIDNAMQDPCPFFNEDGEALTISERGLTMPGDGGTSGWGRY